MKKALYIIATVLFFASCGVGTYSVSSGKEDTASIGFISGDKYPISVDVDGTVYNIETVKTKAYRSGRMIKQTALNAVPASPGKHVVTVRKNGKTVYSKTIFISSGETKIISL